ncbi:ThiF family adenylyltransferase [Candidatus Poriferisodalis sp.]|uniref:ThiF family adenylyltransferase n=1 Tax=Candidatus Poriferisodalis sp. TaxID=3101277 RepID=UPI003B51F021
MAGLTDAQLAAVGDVKEFTKNSSQIRLIGVGDWRGSAALKLEIETSDFPRHDTGLNAEPVERVTVHVAPSYPSTPPRASVEHLRWAGFPHVLQGSRLCIYLDPNIEWDPIRGMQGFLLRLWEWFGDAIAGRFDAATALYQAVGGVLHRTPGAPTIVASLPMPAEITSGDLAHRIGLHQRTENRIDIAAWVPPFEPDLLPGVLVVLPEYLPLGGGHLLSDLLTTVRHQVDRKHRRVMEVSIRRALRSLGEDQFLHVVIAVPNPAHRHCAALHLIGWRLGARDAARALPAARSAATTTSSREEPPVEWTYVDDQRPDVTMRRDSDRPVALFSGSSVAVWGCGALGSWVAELLVRTGAQRVTLRDPGFVTRGLLVRQNYTEVDVGRPKAEALADRLKLLSDPCEVMAVSSYAQDGLEEDATSCDFIFDTSVNTSVNAAVHEAQRRGQLNVPIVQLATDNQTATLGILTITHGNPSITTFDLDEALQEKVADDSSLGPYRVLWNRDDHPPFTPAVGCSVPTFHGSAADAMAVATIALNLASEALRRNVAGAYLFSLPSNSLGAPALVAVAASSVLEPRSDER